MTRKSTLSAESAAVIVHLKAHGASTVKDLRAHFPDVSRTALLKRLGNLVALGWLKFDWTEAGDKTWCVRASARAIPVHTVGSVGSVEAEDAEEAALSAALNPPISVPNLVPPRRINVMAGTYVPPCAAPARPGALDFASVASRGHNC